MAGSYKRDQRLPLNKPENLPKVPGEYIWDHWKSRVTVVKRGAFLYVTPPCKGAVEIRISRSIVGKFKLLPSLPLKETVSG